MKALKSNSLIVNHVIERQDHSTGTCIVLSGKQDRLFVTSRGCKILPSSIINDFLYLCCTMLNRVS